MCPGWQFFHVASNEDDATIAKWYCTVYAYRHSVLSLQVLMASSVNYLIQI